MSTAREHGYYWMTDDDVDDAEPLVQAWVQGSDPVASLEQIMKVREAALQQFSIGAIPASAPLVELQDALVPVYLLHRFEPKAVAAMLGGIHYEHVMRNPQAPVPVPADQQRRALRALLATLSPEALTPPERLLSLMSPRPPEYGATSESFSSDTGKAFDALQSAVEAALLSMGEILRPQRMARLIEYHARDPQLPGLDEVLSAILSATRKDRERTGLQGAVQRAIGRVVLESLFGIARGPGCAPPGSCGLLAGNQRPQALDSSPDVAPNSGMARSFFAGALGHQ